MARALSLISLALMAVLSIFYNGLPVYGLDDKSGVTAHGVLGVLGFGYLGFVSIVLDKGFLSYRARRCVDLLVSVAVVVVCLALHFGNGYIFAAGVITNIIITVYLALKLWRSIPHYKGVYDSDYMPLWVVFVLTAVVITPLSWIYFLYSFFYNYLLMFHTKFSYSLLALSFPFSLSLFSCLMQYWSFSRNKVIALATLVIGVLMLFAGTLMELFWLDVVSAVLLISVVMAVLLRSLRKKEHKMVLYGGLLFTGLLGFLYLLVKGDNSMRIVLMWHSHAAYMLWGIIGYFFVLYPQSLYANIRKVFAVATIGSFTLLSVYFIKENIFLLYISVAIFLLGVGMMLLRGNILSSDRA